MSNSLLSYLEYTKEPWGRMFYSLVWKQLSEIQGKKILDFGSGFGITANQFCKSNDIIAIEPNKEMINLGSNNGFTQLVGNIELLKEFEDNTFDLIICHNVLEYVESRKDLITEFTRILKTNGTLSVIKHNQIGRIMQKIVLENDFEKAKNMINGRTTTSKKFGEIRIYNTNDLIDWSDYQLTIENVFGLGAFYTLQSNEIKYSDNWFSTMFELEMAVSQKQDFISLSAYNHILLRKNNNSSKKHPFI